MREKKRRWARLLPDFRTLYLSLDEIDNHRHIGESDAELLLRSIRYAQRVHEEDGTARLQAREFLARAGLPLEDPLGYELALALVVRARFLQEHPQVVLTAVADGDGDGEREPVQGGGAE